MIALNELIKNSEEFNKKYKLMGKRINLDSILLLEKKFSKLQLKLNTDRSTCNKLCSSVAEMINNNKDTSEIINEINTLDKHINRDTTKLNKMYKKINTKLSKLPNLAKNDNVLNIHIKTKAQDFTINDFVSEISQIAKIQNLSETTKQYLKDKESQIFEMANLPIIIQYKNKISILLTKKEVFNAYDKLVKALKDNSRILIQKSIKSMKKESSEEYRAVLSDKSIIDLKLIEEFNTREFGLKYHDNETDMSKFLNQIDINIYSKNLKIESNEQNSI